MVVGGPACVNTEAVTDPALPRPMSEDYQAPSGAGPITPPPELVEQWNGEGPIGDEESAQYIATQAARWGFKQCMELDAAWLEAKLQKARDEELEACAEWVAHEIGRREWGAQLLADRRPKPPSLAEQALTQTNAILNDPSRALLIEVRETLELTRRALERLQELEGNG